MKRLAAIKRRKNLQLRARIIQAIRNFFGDRNYLEVDTPIRIPAPAPETHIDAIASEEWFLQTSPELCMKRLLAAGFTHIFQICKCFRKKERGRRHLPELTMLEWYTVGWNYLDMMVQCEQLIRFILNELDYGESIFYQGSPINFQTPWTRLSVVEAFEKYASMPLEAALMKKCFDDIMVEEIEPNLGRNPVFLYDYPAALGALAKLKSEDPVVAQRFELYVGGLELCNAFSELTDPVEQRHRFEAERRLRQKMGKSVYPMPEPFLDSLPAMPEAAGNALGIDRLVMLLADTADIDDVVAFTPEAL
jgi:elongation factor P--(R)-beta-lysine ligase